MSNLKKSLADYSPAQTLPALFVRYPNKPIHHPGLTFLNNHCYESHQPNDGWKREDVTLFKNTGNVLKTVG